MVENYYHILGLNNFASSEEIKKAYRRLAKKYHPDRNEGREEQFKRISTAYRKLIDPQSKFRYDQSLKHKHQQPITTSYTVTNRRSYTPTAWMYGKIFIILFIMTVILVPITLLYYSSVTAYEKGLKALNEGDTGAAQLAFHRAIRNFGGRSTAAAIMGARVALYSREDYNEALYFASLGLEHAEKQVRIGELHYLKALAYKKLNKPKIALEELVISDEYLYNSDSIVLQKAQLYAYSLDQYSKGNDSFSIILQRDSTDEVAWFGKAWCLHHMKRNSEALMAYTRVLQINSASPLAYYYRGLTFLSIQDSLAACEDLYKAQHYGYRNIEGLLATYCESDTIN